MSIDSLTVLARLQHRKRLANEDDENQLIELGSGIRRLNTFEDQKPDVSISVECEQDNMRKKSSSLTSLDEDHSNSLNTTSIDTKSYNTSAHTKQKAFKKVV